MAMNREALLGKMQRRYEVVDLTSGGQVRIQSLTEGERTKHEFRTSDASGRFNKDYAEKARASMICLSVVDDDDMPIFQPDELELVHSMDGTDAAEIHHACLELNGYLKPKKKESGPGDSSGTDTESLPD